MVYTLQVKFSFPLSTKFAEKFVNFFIVNRSLHVENKIGLVTFSKVKWPKYLQCPLLQTRITCEIVSENFSKTTVACCNNIHIHTKIAVEVYFNGPIVSVRRCMPQGVTAIKFRLVTPLRKVKKNNTAAMVTSKDNSQISFWSIEQLSIYLICY